MQPRGEFKNCCILIGLTTLEQELRIWFRRIVFLPCIEAVECSLKLFWRDLAC